MHILGKSDFYVLSIINIKILSQQNALTLWLPTSYLDSVILNFGNNMHKDRLWPGKHETEKQGLFAIFEAP